MHYKRAEIAEEIHWLRNNTAIEYWSHHHFITYRRLREWRLKVDQRYQKLLSQPVDEMKKWNGKEDLGGMAAARSWMNEWEKARSVISWKFYVRFYDVEKFNDCCPVHREPDPPMQRSDGSEIDLRYRLKYSMFQQAYRERVRHLRTKKHVWAVVDRWKQVKGKDGDFAHPRIESEVRNFCDRLGNASLPPMALTFIDTGFNDDPWWRDHSPEAEEWREELLLDRMMEEAEIRQRERWRSKVEMKLSRLKELRQQFGSSMAVLEYLGENPAALEPEL